MPYSETYVAHILDQLADFGTVEAKKMFGGVGLFHEGRMFGKIGSDTLYFKVDAHNQADYEAKGMQAFYSSKKKKGMPYWTVPPDVIEDKQQLEQWAAKAYEAAQRAKP